MGRLRDSLRSCSQCSDDRSTTRAVVALTTRKGHQLPVPNKLCFLSLSFLLFCLCELGACARPILAATPSCQRVEDCAVGETCVLGTCSADSGLASCENDDECDTAAGETCQSGLCGGGGGGGGSCTENAGCALTEFCNVNTGRCATLASGSCRQDSQCTNPAATLCNNGVVGSTAVGRCSECRTDADCNAESCLNGVCGGGGGGGDGGGDGGASSGGCDSQTAACTTISPGDFCLEPTGEPPLGTVECTDTDTCSAGFVCIAATDNSGNEVGVCLQECTIDGGGGGGGGGNECVESFDCFFVKLNSTCENGQCVCDEFLLSLICPEGIDTAICDCAGEGGGGGGGTGAGSCTDTSLTCSDVQLTDTNESISICTDSDGTPPAGAPTCSISIPCAANALCLFNGNAEICLETCTHDAVGGGG